MLELAETDFDELFPFHIRFDGAGQLLSFGSSLRRVAPWHVKTQTFEELVEVRRPKRSALHELTRAGTFDGLVLLTVRGSALSLRGQIATLDGGTSFVFLGSPWVTDPDAMVHAGLVAKDFARHDPTVDLMILLGTLQTSLAESRELGRELEARQDHLERARREAEEANRAKSCFLAMMSHEIRTPMNGLGSMVDLLRETQLSETQLELTDVILSCAESLGSLLNDILDVSKIEAGLMELESIEFSPASVVREIATLHRSAAAERSVELSVRIPPDVPDSAIGDPTRLGQILSNLLGNAAKFTTEGEIVVEVQNVEHGEGVVRLRFAVHDTGAGVTDDARARIFAPFTQGELGTARRYGGTGLGLTICKLLSGLMGGDVWLERSSSAGSTFGFEVELRHAAESSVQRTHRASGTAGSTTSFKGARALVAEDAATNRVIADRLLRKLGVEPVFANDGTEALAELDNGSFDIVLMDVEMPGMDGYEVTRRWRAIESEQGERVPILALTAHALPEYQRLALAAGMDEVVTKPIRLHTLAEALGRWLPADDVTRRSA